jgi:hypothetical protein
VKWWNDVRANPRMETISKRAGFDVKGKVECTWFNLIDHQNCPSQFAISPKDVDVPS